MAISQPHRHKSVADCWLYPFHRKTYSLKRLCSGVSALLASAGLLTAGNVWVVRGIVSSRHVDSWYLVIVEDLLDWRKVIRLTEMARLCNGD